MLKSQLKSAFKSNWGNNRDIRFNKRDQKGEISMKNEPVHENEPKTSLAAEKGPAESKAASTWRMIGNTELVAGSPRQIVDGGLLGIYIAVLISLLNMQHKDIDAQLSTALITFIIAMPVLAYGFLCTFYKKPTIVPHSGPSNLFAAMLVGAWVAEGIGWLAAYIGICFVLWHVSSLALIAFLSASTFVVLILPFLSAIGLAVYAVREFKKQGGKEHETSLAAPAQAKETTVQALTDS